MGKEDLLGTFVWHDLMTTDVAAARAFYTEVIGWKLQDWEDAKGSEPYTMWLAGEKAIGGVATLPDEAKKMGAPPHWHAYVGTPDVDATAARATELGATLLVPPRDIPKVGRFSIIQDPQGAVQAAFTPEGGEGTAPGQGPGFFSWAELMTSDLDGAVAFYEALYGWQETRTMDMGPDLGPYRMFGKDGETSLGGMMKLPPQMPQGLGGKVFSGPMEVPGGDRVAQIVDPQGAMLGLHQSA